MSTKIYYAYRAPMDHVNEAIDWLRESMMEAVIGYLIWLTDDAKDMSVALTEVEAQGFDSMRNHWDISCGFNLWIHSGYAYIIPIAEGFIMKRVGDPPSWLVDYSYWDNVDPPEDMTESEWELRGEQWKRLCTGTGKSAHNARRLYHDVVSPSLSLGLFELEQELRERGYKVDSKERRKRQVERRKLLKEFNRD